MSTTTVITDQDVLTVIATDDEIASDIDAGFTASLGLVSPAALLAWQGDLAAYRAWAAAARDKLEGGFFFGQWFGVPDAYNTAANWGARLRNHAKDLPAGAVPSLPDVPPPSAPTQVPDINLGTDTKLLIALVAVAVIVVARKL